MKKTITYLNIPFRLEVNRFIMSLLFLCMLQQSFAQVIGPGDWSSLRLYGHAYNVNGFTNAEYDWIANHNYMFTTEKRNAYLVYGSPSSEYASQVAATEIKSRNPITKPLFYWNSTITYSAVYQTAADALAEHPEWAYINESNGTEYWDYENADFREWWVDVATDQINNYDHEGIFLDATGRVENSGWFPYYFDMLDQLPGYKIYNGFYTTNAGGLLGGLDLLEHADAVYIEAFFHYTCNTPDKGKQLMDRILQIPADKGFVASYNAESAWNSTDHKFGMACYLIGANDNSFFRYAVGGYTTDNLVLWHDDFGKYIGAPKGVATVNGYVYTRSFENAEVTVDLLNKTSSIVWGTISPPVNGVSVTPSSASLSVGGVTPLSAVVSPSSATDQSITWSSNNTSVASVNSSGLVTAIGVGSATITATTSDGGYTDGCLVTVTAGGADTNLALFGTASQSSTNNDGEASRAIDDNTNGAWSGGSVTHTASGTNAWWEVDLGEEYSIGDINIFGRTDACCEARLSDYTVSVLNAEGTIVFSQNFTTYPTSSTNAGYVIGQTIRVQLNVTSALSLAEVQVYGKATSLSVDEVYIDEDISIYPNPTSSMLTIKFTGAETADVSIFDITGRTVLSNTISNGSSSIDTSSLPTGLYMIRISTENKTYAKKLIKR